MSLTVAEYNRAEAAAEVELPNRLIQACRPELFATVGYPSRVADDRALFRYVDVMHELRFDNDFPVFAGKLTDEEYELFQRITAAVASFTEERYGRRIIPKGALLRALPVFRHIRMVQPDTSAAIVEIGPGSGYLTALLGLAGYSVIATDVAQAFYLWQSTLWHHLFGERFVDLAGDPRSFAECPTDAIVNVPWWKFTTIEPERVVLPIDIVTANHVLCEMHLDAFTYLTRLCQQWFKNHATGKLMFEGPGSSLLRNPVDALKAFNERGIATVFADNQIHVMAMAPGQIKERIKAGRSTLEEAKRIGFQEVRAMQIEILNGHDMWTDDERFWRMLHGTEHYS
jgi:hypothetical protein